MIPDRYGHSGAEPTGPARSGRPDDKLREEPGIHILDPRLWIPDLPPSRQSGMTGYCAALGKQTNVGELSPERRKNKKMERQ